MNIRIFLFMLIIIIATAFRCDHADLVGMVIHGDFNGDKIQDHATSAPVRQYYPNRADGTTQWMVHFEPKEIPEFFIGCCMAYLINEGDLNYDGKEEISLFQKASDPNSCYYYISTYTLKDGKWEKIIEPFPVVKGCEGFMQEDLLAKVYLNKKSVYYIVDTATTPQHIKAF